MVKRVAFKIRAAFKTTYALNGDKNLLILGHLMDNSGLLIIPQLLASPNVSQTQTISTYR